MRIIKQTALKYHGIGNIWIFLIEKITETLLFSVLNELCSLYAYINISKGRQPWLLYSEVYTRLSSFVQKVVPHTFGILLKSDVRQA